jgi:hypothetical protein
MYSLVVWLRRYYFGKTGNKETDERLGVELETRRL